MLRIGTRVGTVATSLIIGLVGMAVALSSMASGQTGLSRIVVFGDSLSDTGNAFALGRENNTPPSYAVDPLLVPDDAYARGGHHFTNGATWAEDLARPLGLASDVSPAFRDADPGATNYAVGGARAHDDLKNVDLSVQVQAFLGDFRNSAPANALYVIEIGGNDVRDALAALLTGQDPTAINVSGLGSIGTNISSLYAAGARRFLVWNVGNIGLTPAVRTLDAQFGPGIAVAANTLTQSFNANLEGLLVTLQQALPGIQIMEFDLYGALDEIYTSPMSFGLSDVADPCIAPNTPPFVCKNPDQYLFWDGIHPTKAVHEIVAREVAALLGVELP